jgi:hypothetical protein
LIVTVEVKKVTPRREVLSDFALLLLLARHARQLYQIPAMVSKALTLWQCVFLRKTIHLNRCARQLPSNRRLRPSRADHVTAAARSNAQGGFSALQHSGPDLIGVIWVRGAAQ